MKILAMNKKMCLMTIVFVFAFTSVAYGQSTKSITLSIDGQQIVFTEADGYGVPYIDANGWTQVPIRKPLEAIGASVNYNEETEDIIIEKDGTMITFNAYGSMYVNDWRRYNAANATIVSGRSYIPIRFVFEELGYTVDWDAPTFHISVNKRTDTEARDPEVSEGWGVDSAIAVMFYNAEIGLYLPETFRENEEHYPTKAEDFFFGTIFIYNRTGRDIIIEPFDIELQVYKISGNEEDLVLHKKLPAAKGMITSNCAMQTSISSPGSLDLEPGSYRVKYTCSDVIRFSYADDEEAHIHYVNTEYALQRPFESILVLE